MCKVYLLIAWNECVNFEYIKNATVNITLIGDSDIGGLKLGQTAAAIEICHNGPIVAW